MKLIVCDNYENASQKAAELFISVVQQKPTAVLGLATGSTPLGMYRYLVADHQKNHTSYQQISTYNLDEYVGLDGSNPQSYRYFMNENFFRSINIDLAHTHVPDGKGDQAQISRQYDALLEQLGPADIQVLGMGFNGHIAFNEPGTAFDLTTHVVDLAPETIAANARFFDHLEEVPKQAISMGIASILASRQIVLLVFGQGKAKALHAALQGPVTTNLPASVLQNHPHVTVITDCEAASLLDN